MPKRLLSKEDLEKALLANPSARLKDLKRLFSCGSGTIQRELRRHGLRTLPLSERPKPWLEGDSNPLRKWHQENPEFGERQRGVSNPVHGVLHLYRNPTYVRKITSGIRAHTNNKRGKTYEEVYGEEKAEAYRAKLRATSPARLSKFKRKVTGPELMLRGILGRIGLDFIEQAPIGPYTVDFLVPSHRLVVQADGDYWHANPELYSDRSSLSKSQSKQQRLDASCDSFLRNQGYEVARFWETELYNDTQKCEQTLRDRMQT